MYIIKSPQNYPLQSFYGDYSSVLQVTLVSNDKHHRITLTMLSGRNDVTIIPRIFDNFVEVFY